jgi:hypothetical protein
VLDYSGTDGVLTSGMENPFLALFEDARPQKVEAPASKIEEPWSPKKVTDLTSGASRLQGPILQNSASAKNFYEKLSFSNFWLISL